jgi:ferredoxin
MKLVRPSTLALVREARRASDFSLFDLIHGYLYGRWPYLYIGIGTGEHWIARRLGPLVGWFARLLSSRPKEEANGGGWADGYHGKVVPTRAAAQLVTVPVGQEVRLENLEQIIPYPRARDIILQHADHIVALECPCRAARPDPCLPLDVCLIVGEPFASFVQEHHPHRSRWISSGEGIEILEAEHERGHVHHAFFKDAMLGRFYAICNCCACCCGAMQAHRGGTPMLASSGYVARIDPDLCAACGLCAEVCPFGALYLSSNVAVIESGVCMGCGVCVSQCATGALSLVRDPSRGTPLELYRLMEHAPRLP